MKKTVSANVLENGLAERSTAQAAAAAALVDSPADFGLAQAGAEAAAVIRQPLRSAIPSVLATEVPPPGPHRPRLPPRAVPRPRLVDHPGHLLGHLLGRYVDRQPRRPAITLRPTIPMALHCIQQDLEGLVPCL